MTRSPGVAFCRTLILAAAAAALTLPAPASSQQVRWTFQTQGPIYSSPAQEGETIFVGSGDGHLYAVHAETGIEVWRYRTDGAVDATPAVAEGVVFVPSRDGWLHAVDAETGAARWQFETRGERKVDFWDFYLSDPLVTDGVVVFGSGDGSVYALDRVTGELRWRHRTGHPVHAGPVAGHGLVYVGGFDGILYALDVRTGSPVWTFETEGHEHFPRGDIQRGPTLDRSVLYFGSRDYHIYAVDARTGDLLWQTREGDGWIIAAPLVHRDALYYGASDGQRFYAADRRTGRVIWSLPVQTRVFGSAVLADQVLVAGGFNGKLFGVDPASGELRWTFQTPASQTNFASVYDANGEMNQEMRQLYRDGEWRSAEERILTLGSIPGTPLLLGTTVFFGTTEGILYALELP